MLRKSTSLDKHKSPNIKGLVNGAIAEQREPTEAEAAAKALAQAKETQEYAQRLLNSCEERLKNEVDDMDKVY